MFEINQLGETTAVQTEKCKLVKQILICQSGI